MIVVTYQMMASLWFIVAVALAMNYAWHTNDPTWLRLTVEFAIGAPSGSLLFLALFGNS
jgi:hypothetical protein